MLLTWQEWYGALAKEIFNPNYAKTSVASRLASIFKHGESASPHD